VHQRDKKEALAAGRKAAQACKNEIDAERAAAREAAEGQEMVQE
jgi:hypothetical protein